jgi:hypothetical protein
MPKNIHFEIELQKMHLKYCFKSVKNYKFGELYCEKFANFENFANFES